MWCATHKKSLYEICGQRRPRPACAFAQAEKGLRCPAYRINGYCSICWRTEMVQITLHGCACLSVLSLFAYGITDFFARCPSCVFNWSFYWWLGVCLTHLNLASHKRDISKQCRPRWDAAERDVWSGSTLFALSTGISVNYGKNKKHTRHPFYLKWTGPKGKGRRIHSAQTG